jgi:hypothetical protein
MCKDDYQLVKATTLITILGINTDYKTPIDKTTLGYRRFTFAS